MPSPRQAELPHLLAPLILLALAVLPLPAFSQSLQPPLPPTPTMPEFARHGHVQRTDARIWFATFGNERAPAVLLLHGGGGSSDYWGDLIRELAADYHVIVVDARGQGRSTNEASAISYEQMARDAITVLDRLAIRETAVVGWSDGANVGFYLALRFPERVAALIAFAGNATPAGYQPNSNPAAMRAYVARTRAEYRKLSPQPERHGEITKILAAMWKSQPDLSAADLGRIRSRTAILHGEQDEIIRRSHAGEIAAQIPGARFVLLPGAGHFAPLTQREAFNKAVRDFLSGR
jgi:pimeloyl-ACP methyl ester carboxylesterase